ncbi:MAG: alpha/beta hydrolase-fold protein [Planctomycetota bacterium]
MPRARWANLAIFIAEGVLIMGALFLLLALLECDEQAQGLDWPRLPPCTAEGSAPACEVERAFTPEDVAARLAGRDEAVWCEQEELVFLHRAKADAIFLNGGLQAPMHRVGTSNYWSLVARVRDLPKATIGYAFLPLRSAVPLWDAQVFRAWRGSQAPPEPPHVESLAGSIETHELDAPLLDGSRRLTVYRTPIRGAPEPLRVVYLTDGHMTADLARFIEPLITQASLPPVLLVGVHAAASSGLVRYGEKRAAEYLEPHDSERFAAHEKFFMDEVMPWAEKTCGASHERRERALFGVSNGGAFVLSLALRHRDRVGNVVAFSVASSRPLKPEAPDTRFYFVAGTLEPPLLELTKEWAKRLAEGGAETVFRERVAGHDAVMWREEFPAALQWIFR